MESQSSKGDPSKSPVSGGGKGDPSKSPMSDGGKGGSSLTAKPNRLPIKRPPEHATRGRRITLLTNHFKVTLKRTDQILYHYNVHPLSHPMVSFGGYFLTICFEIFVPSSAGESEV